jgi:isocitrate dehydrogenase (NAD+)
MGLHDHANKIQTATFKVLKEGQHVTKDLGGNATTSEYTDAIIRSL